jgi:cell division protein FtsB
MLQMLGQIEALQTEIQKLRGMAEQQSHEINKLKQREQNI